MFQYDFDMTGWSVQARKPDIFQNLWKFWRNSASFAENEWILKKKLVKIVLKIAPNLEKILKKIPWQFHEDTLKNG